MRVLNMRRNKLSDRKLIEFHSFLSSEGLNQTYTEYILNSRKALSLKILG